MQVAIKIAQITLSMGTGGLENVICSLVQSIDKDIFESEVVCLDSGGVLLEKLVNHGVNGLVYKRKPGLDLRIIMRLNKLFREKKFQIVHTHNQAAHFYGGIAAKLAKVPVLINTEHSRHSIDEYFRRRLEKFLLSLATTKLVAVSSELADLSMSKDKIPKNKIVVIPNGIDVRYYSRVSSKMTIRKKMEYKRILGLPKNSKVLITVGRLHPIKNHELLFNAISSSKWASENDLHVLVVGDGQWRNRLREQCYSNGIAEHVHFLGRRSDIAELLSISDAFILCSKTEGLPLALLEAMASKIPSVVTRGANKSQIVEHGKNGIVVDMSPRELMQGIKKLLLDSEFAKALAETAYHYVKRRHSLEKMVYDYSNLYKILMK